MEQVDGLFLVGGEGEVAADHDALRDGRIADEAELRRDDALVHLTRVRERGLLAVNRDAAARYRVVLKRPAQKPRRFDRSAVVAEAGGAPLGQLDHLG